MSSKTGIPETTLAEAWCLRQQGCFTLREIADRLKVNREELRDQLMEWLLKRQEGRNGDQN